jgi:hypothetical protein
MSRSRNATARNARLEMRVKMAQGKEEQEKGECGLKERLM